MARRMQPPPGRHVACVSTGSFRRAHRRGGLWHHVDGLVLASTIAFDLGATDLAKEFLERRMIRHLRMSEMDDLQHW